MKIIQINTVYKSGSTGKITASLYNMALERGYEAAVAYGRGHTPEGNDINGLLVGNKIDFLHHVIVNFVTGRNGFASKKVTRKLLNWLDKEKPDVIHLHNIHGFYVHVGMLFEYIKKKDIPVVWTLHDCWPFTGQCAHFDYAGCMKWKTGCFNCIIHRTDYPYSIFRDNSRNNYYLKKEAFQGAKRLTIVTPSKWLADLVSQSFLKEYPIKVIPNGIDRDIFAPNKCRDIQYPKIEALRGTKIILGVANVWDNRKGLSYLLELSHIFNSSNGYRIVIIGLSKRQCQQIRKKYGSEILPLTRTSSQEELASWYSSAYVYVNTSLQENFPTTNLEALACGTPVITFDSGGSGETITDENGSIVSKGDEKALENEIKKLDSRDLKAEVIRSSVLKYDQRDAFDPYFLIYSLYMNKV